MNIAQHLGLALIRGYRRLWIPVQISLLGPAPACRFIPTCSAYAEQAIRLHGIAGGGTLAAKRLCRCHPWGGFGLDPVPTLGAVSSSSLLLPD